MPASRRSWADWAETYQVSGGVAERSPSALQLRLDLAAAVEGRVHFAESSARAGPVSCSALPALQLRLDLAAAVEGRAHVAESSARAGPVSCSALPQQGRGGNRWPILSRLASR